MRVAYVCADAGVPVFGRKGCSVHAQEVVRALLKQGAQVELFAARTGGEPPQDLAASRVHPLPDLPKGDTSAREQAAYKANGALRGALERAGRFDLIYERYSLWSFAAMEYARETDAPGLLEVNAPLIEEQARHRGLVNRALAEQVAERVFNAATELVAVSDEVASYLNGYASVRGRVHVVPNGVDADRFPRHQKPAVPSPPGTFTVGFVGTLKPWHGLPCLIEAFTRLHQRDSRARLLIVGEGPERGRIADRLRANSLLGAAHLTGAVHPREIPGLLASMDAGVAPYPADSSFYFSPLKVYEYMAARLPVVASRVGQLRDLIEHEVNGLLIEPGDAEALADALERLCEDDELRVRLGEAARATVLEKHTWDAVARRVLTLAGFGANEPAERASSRQCTEVMI